MASAQRKQKQHVIWARCAVPAQLEQVKALEDLLRKDGDAVHFLCTLPDPESTEALAAPKGQRDVRKFIFGHRPIAVLWLGGELDHAALAPCHVVDLPIVVLEATPNMLKTVNGGWLPNRSRANLARLHRVFVKDPSARPAFLNAGVPEQAVQTAGSLDDTSTVLTYRETDRVELAHALGTRPVWLAANVSVADIPTICAAHREAARRAHRLLMIIAPDNLNDGPKIAAKCRELGWNTSLRSEGAEPEEATQVFVGDDPDEMGLWYRIAPITFVGGTFGSGAKDDPFHPAALGSVAIHGPAQGKFQSHFKQLVDANATFPIAKAAVLGEAVAALLAVDMAAEKANAGWDITSRGAGAMALVGATLQDLIDGENG